MCSGRLLFRLGSLGAIAQHPVAVATGSRTTLSGSAGSLLVISIVIVVLIDVHLTRSRLMGWNLLIASRFFLYLG